MAAGSSASSKVVLLACLLALCHGTYGGEFYGKKTEEEGCIVLHSASFLTPRSVNILSYITPKQPMSIELTYNGRDENTYKDVVELSNTEATHRAWEKGSYTAARHLFPINMTKGWNTLTLTAAEEDIALTYMTWEDKEVREHRQLHSTIKTIYLKGNFSLCSGASPEWLVSDNIEVAVPLDYQSEARQLLEVTGDGSSSTFLKLSEGEKYVPATTTLALSTTQQASGYTVEVKVGDECLGNYSSSEPAVVMGSRQGNSRLRLKRETSSPPPTTPPTTESTGCIVRDEQVLRTPFKDTLLAYITSEKTLDLMVTFKDHNRDLRRDVVTMSNDAASHVEVREGNAQSSVTHHFLTKMPEGWVTLILTAEEKYVSMVWVDGQEERTLITLTMDSDAEEHFLEGQFSFCSGDSPEWLVNENEEVSVMLDYKSYDQELEVTGASSTEAYLKLSKGQFDVPANTTLWINTSQKDSEATVKVFFKEKQVTKQVLSPLPTVVMGGRRGSTHLRLKRSASSPSSPSPSLTISPCLVTTVVLPVLLVVSIVGNLFARRRNKVTKAAAEPKEQNAEKKSILNENETTETQETVSADSWC